jgi:short-subunit dehydrogenase
VFLGCIVSGRRFVDQGTPAHIVNTGSETSLGMVAPNVGMYMATKHAVLALSDTLRNELPDQVGVSILCPGSLSSDIQTSSRTVTSATVGRCRVLHPRGVPARSRAG